MIKRINRKMTIEERVTRLERLLGCSNRLAKVEGRTIWDDMAGIPEVVDFSDPYFKCKIEELVKRFQKFNAELINLSNQRFSIMTDNLRVDIDYDEDEGYTVTSYDCLDDLEDKSFDSFTQVVKFVSKVINEVESPLH